MRLSTCALWFAAASVALFVMTYRGPCEGTVRHGMDTYGTCYYSRETFDDSDFCRDVITLPPPLAPQVSSAHVMCDASKRRTWKCAVKDNQVFDDVFPSVEAQENYHLAKSLGTMPLPWVFFACLLYSDAYHPIFDR